MLQGWFPHQDTWIFSGMQVPELSPPLCDSEIRGWPKNVVTDKAPSYFCTSV